MEEAGRPAQAGKAPRPGRGRSAAGGGIWPTVPAWPGGYQGGARWGVLPREIRGRAGHLCIRNNEERGRREWGGSYYHRNST